MRPRTLLNNNTHRLTILGTTRTRRAIDRLMSAFTTALRHRGLRTIIIVRVRIRNQCSLINMIILRFIRATHRITNVIIMSRNRQPSGVLVKHTRLLLNSQNTGRITRNLKTINRITTTHSLFIGATRRIIQYNGQGTSRLKTKTAAITTYIAVHPIQVLILMPTTILVFNRIAPTSQDQQDYNQPQ